MSHVLVTGANGQLGREIKKMRNRFRQTYAFTDVDELDATDLSALKSYLASNPVDFIINCAAYTDVEGAEKEPKEAEKLNRDILVRGVQICPYDPYLNRLCISGRAAKAHQGG